MPSASSSVPTTCENVRGDAPALDVTQHRDGKGLWRLEAEDEVADRDEA
jgi:hypothetical protein